MFTVPVESPDMLARLREIFSFVMSTEQSDFYRNRFGYLGFSNDFPHSLEEWNKLPVLERNDIVSVPFWDRTFVPRSQVMCFRHTSGTSGRKPLITPRRAFGDYAAAPTLAGVKRQISFLYGWYISEKARRINGAIVMNCYYPESVEDCKYVTALAKRFRPDSLLGYPSLLILLAPYFKEAGILKDIRILELNGERCSETQREALMRLYNNPTVFNQFSSSESAGVYGGPCTKILERSSLDFHLSGEYLMTEFVDPETLLPADPRIETCETLQTSLTTDQPLPLIRYRTGDLLEASKEECGCERGGYTFTSHGRADSDRVKFLDGVIAVGKLEEALAGCKDSVGIDYEAHYYEEACEDGVLRGRIVLHVAPKDGGIDLMSVAHRIAERFMISAILSYKEAVEHRFLLPLTVVPLKRKARSFAPKHKRLFRHSP